MLGAVSAWLDRLTAKLTVHPALVPPRDGVRRAAVAAVLRDAPDGPSVLLMKRTERASDPWSGHVSLPGGSYEPDDRDLLATAIRETREELAVDLATARLLGSLTALHPRTSGPKGIEVTPFVFAATPGVALDPRPGPEAQATFWLPLATAASGALDAMYDYPGLQGSSWPSWHHDGHVIWGMTMRILGELIELAR
jgi:8-oxo-dGTP pyrophosphatase MutT (NUDIX family)